MRSRAARQTDSPQFRLRWRGYDRAEVDEFLRQTAADRRRLQEDLAQLEAVMAGRRAVHFGELERLAALRIEIASCLETSMAALQTATQRLSSAPEVPPVSPQPVRQAADRTPPRFRLHWPPPQRSKFAMASGLGALVMWAAPVTGLVLLVLVFQHYPGQKTAVAHAAASQDLSPATPPEPVLKPVAEPVPPSIDGLLLTLTAREVCWIRTTVDGAQSLERLLHPNDTILLRAKDEAVIRVGDAGALSVLINNQPAKPLGEPGQVVTRRITLTNYPDFLSGT